MKKVLIGVVLLILVGCGIGFYAFDKIGGVLLEEMLTVEPDSSFDLFGLEPADSSDSSAGSPAPSAGKQDPDGDISREGKSGQGMTADPVPGSSGKPQKSGMSNGAAQDGRSAGKADTDAGIPGGTHASPQRTTVGDIRDRVSLSDKLTVTRLVMKRLSKSDLHTLESMLSGGLTPEERRQARDLVYGRFTSAEVEQLRQLYRKYTE